MKGFKLLALVLAAGIFLAPATAMASPRFSFSLNLFDCMPYFVAPRPCVVHHVVMPQPVVRPVVREYYYYYSYPRVVEDEVRILPYPYPIPPTP